jgi:hypothetical protein
MLEQPTQPIIHIERGDEPALLRLWREESSVAGPADRSANLIFQLGLGE